MFCLVCSAKGGLDRMSPFWGCGLQHAAQSGFVLSQHAVTALLCWSCSRDLLVQHAEDAILSTVKPWLYREGVSVYERHVNVTDLPATEG